MTDLRRGSRTRLTLDKLRIQRAAQGRGFHAAGDPPAVTVKWRRPIGIALVASLVCSGATPAAAQTLSQRGFVEARVTLFPQEAPNDRATRRRSTCWRAKRCSSSRPPGCSSPAASTCAQNSHDQVDDRGASTSPIAAPCGRRLSVRRLAATIDARPVHGRRRQAVHPLGQDRHRHPDRPFRAARLPERHRHRVSRRHRRRAASLQIGAHTFEAVWVAAFTPSRMPLSTSDGRRRRRHRSRSRLPAVTPSSPTAHRSGFAGATSHDARRVLAVGIRRLQPPAEHRGAVPAPQPGAITLVRSYPTMRSYGADVAMPTPWFTVKGEAAYFDAPIRPRPTTTCSTSCSSSARAANGASRRLCRRSRDHATRRGDASRPTAG